MGRIFSVPRTAWLFMDNMVAILLGGSALIAFVVAAQTRGSTPPTNQVGSVSWEFTKSWSSSASLLLALYQLLLGFDLLPAIPAVLDKPRYQMLAVVFAGLVLVAPVVFLASADYRKEKDVIVPVGTVRRLLVSGFTVLWAVTGQALVAVMTAFELLATPGFSPVLSVFLGAMAIAILLLGLAHGRRTLTHAIRESTSPPPDPDSAGTALPGSWVFP